MTQTMTAPDLIHKVFFTDAGNRIEATVVHDMHEVIRQQQASGAAWLSFTDIHGSLIELPAARVITVNSRQVANEPANKEAREPKADSEAAIEQTERTAGQVVQGAGAEPNV